LSGSVEHREYLFRNSIKRVVFRHNPLDREELKVAPWD
jgi:hypothetical protein